MRICLLLFCTSYFLLPNTLWAIHEKGPSLEKAIQLAIDQQILAQSLTNTYLILCHNPKDVLQYSIRARGIARFEEQLHQLSLLVPTARIRTNIQQVRTSWQSYKALVDWSIKKGSVEAVIKQAADLQEACNLLHAAYREYEYGFKQNSYLVTINQYIHQAHQEKIVLARLTTYHLADQFVTDPTEYQAILWADRQKFMRNLVILQRATTGAELVQDKLTEVENQWKRMEPLLANPPRSLEGREAWLVQVGQTLECLDNIIKQYQQLSREISKNHLIRASIAQTINLQKITSLYLLLVKEPDNSAYYKDLQQAIHDFEVGLDALQVTTTTTESMQRAIEVAQTLWNNYKSIAIKSQGRDELQAIKLLEQCHVLTAACDQIEQAAHDFRASDSNEALSAQVQRLYRMQVYLQRLYVYKQMSVLGLDQRLSQKRLEECTAGVNQLMQKVEQASDQEAGAKLRIQQLSVEWERCQTAINGTNLEALYQQKEALVESLDRLTHWYDRQLEVSFAQEY